MSTKIQSTSKFVSFSFNRCELNVKIQSAHQQQIKYIKILWSANGTGKISNREHTKRLTRKADATVQCGSHSQWILNGKFM